MKDPGASYRRPNFQDLWQGEVRGIFQPVEKVVVCPIGTPEEAQNKIKRYRYDIFSP
jgi:hypothetical protein